MSQSKTFQGLLCAALAASALLPTPRVATAGDADAAAASAATASPDGASAAETQGAIAATIGGPKGGAGMPRPAAPGAVGPAQSRPAVVSRKAAQSVMLGAAHAGTRVVVVGERGIILLSDDNGKHWRQADVPVSVTLTAVRFADARNGVAVGHAGVVLTTTDGGAHWQRVLDGQQLAALALQAAQAASTAAPAPAERPAASVDAALGAERPATNAAVRDAERLVADGADKPLLDVCLLGAGRILAVGAYGLAFASEDAGRTWMPWMDRIANPKGQHLNTVRANGDTILIAGERGFAQLSTDAGRSFKPLNVPYQGSFFTAELNSDKDILLAGLRGNAWRSTDAGKSWQQLTSPMPVSITSSTKRADGTLVLANQAGILLTVRDQTLVPRGGAPLPPLNGVLDLNNGALLALSIQGILPVAGEKP